MKSIPERDHLFFTNENLPAELDYGKAKVLTNLNLEGNKRRSTVMPGNMSANILGLKGLASEVEKRVSRETSTPMVLKSMGLKKVSQEVSQTDKAPKKSSNKFINQIRNQGHGRSALTQSPGRYPIKTN